MTSHPSRSTILNGYDSMRRLAFICHHQKPYSIKTIYIQENWEIQCCSTRKTFFSRDLGIMWQVAVGIWFSYYPAYFLRRRRVKDNNLSKKCTQPLSSSAVKDVRIELSNLFGLFTPINCRKLHHLSAFLFSIFCEMYDAIKWKPFWELYLSGIPFCFEKVLNISESVIWGTNFRTPFYFQYETWMNEYKNIDRKLFRKNTKSR